MKPNFIRHLSSITTCTLLIGLLAGCGKSGSVKNPDVTWEQCLRDVTNTLETASLDPLSLRTITSHDPSGGNNDFNNFAGRSRDAGWVVLIDEKGPGCVRRFWMTGTDPGHPIRIFIDGEKSPRLASTLDDLFGKTAPWLPPLSEYINMCFYSYVPITFNKSIRIEVKEPNVHPLWGPRRIFFQAAVETFPAGTTVESYPSAMTPEQLAAAARISATLQARIDSRDIQFDSAQPPVMIAPNSNATVFESNGRGFIDHWAIDVQPAEPSAWTALERSELVNDTVLRIYYDGSSFPSVDVPLGSFFANAWNKRSYSSLWMTSGKSGYECRLPLPFNAGVRFEIINGADRPIRVQFSQSSRDYPEGNYGYLHSEFRRSGPGGAQNHVISQISGRGKYVGCFLGVTGLDPSWWILEGDETMWTDGNTQPVWRGTGLEDYFNGGWYYRGAAFGIFNANFDRSPFRVAQFRHQQLDPVTFDRSFAIEIERMRNEQDGQPVKGYFESTAYLYMEKPTPVSPCPTSREERRAVADPNYQKTLMLQLVELERSNDFEGALHAVELYLERFPESEDAGVYRLRLLEYRRLLGETIESGAYEPFLNGSQGPAAQEQAKLLDWFYAADNRAIVGLSVNGKGKLFVDGKLILNGDHPFYLFVAGMELSPGAHQIAAQVDYQRDSPWLQVGVRSHTGIAGTGPGTASSLDAGTTWRTDPVASLNWPRCDLRLIPRGVPDAPFIGGIANAFVLVQSKSYPVSAPDWIYYRKTAYFREDFTSPIEGWPHFSISTTGLSK